MFPVSDVALYFPYVDLPGDEWVKAAALHWPRLGRIRPSDYHDVRDSGATAPGGSADGLPGGADRRPLSRPAEYGRIPPGSPGRRIRIGDLDSRGVTGAT
ncbi:hypothetical protein GCM10027615_22030 [Plantactinospora veratri]